MTQESLSEITGSTPQAISNYERGERELRAGMIIKMADALRDTTDYLLTGKSNSITFSTKFNNLSQDDKGCEQKEDIGHFICLQ